MYMYTLHFTYVYVHFYNMYTLIGNFFKASRLLSFLNPIDFQ